MTAQAPPIRVPVPALTGVLGVETAAEATDLVSALLQREGWRGGHAVPKTAASREGDAGYALLQIFGRLTDLVLTRLNQAPDKHFLAFLNEAGVDLLAPRPASAELTFKPADDGPAFIRVPAGTQVATAQTETTPEIIFETQRDLLVAPNALIACLAVDPLAYSDRLDVATGRAQSGSFAAFQGQQERERILYLGDAALLAFQDEASRKAATLSLAFRLAVAGDPGTGGWRLQWLYWDGCGWADLTAAGGATLVDGTANFSRDGTLQLSNLPALAECEVDGVNGLWLACKLTGGVGRQYLPALAEIKGSRRIDMTARQTAADSAAFSAVQANTAFVSLELADESFPLGQRPGRLDTFYLMSSEAFGKPGAAVSIEMDSLAGLPAGATSADLAALQVKWEYYSTAGWTELGSATMRSSTPARLDFEDNTLAFTKSGEGTQAPKVTFKIPAAGGNDPLFAATEVNGQAGLWVRARIVAGSYNLPAWVEIINRDTGSYQLHEAVTYPPLVRGLRVVYSGYQTALAERPLERCRSRVDGEPRNHQQALAAGQAIRPFSAPDEEPALYLGFQRAWPAGEWIQLLLDVAEAAETGLAEAVYWEYWNGQRWAALRMADGSRGLAERGYLGFFAPTDHANASQFGRTAYWLRARPHRPPVAAAGPDQRVATAAAEASLTLDASGSQALDGEEIVSYAWRLLSDKLPTARAGADLRVVTTGDEAAITLDASTSSASSGWPIRSYTWSQAGVTTASRTWSRHLRMHARQQAIRDANAVQVYADYSTGVWPAAAVSPKLKAIRINTTPALNAVTVVDEPLGSSDGKPGQRFQLARTPLLADAQIVVREPDRPSAGELVALEAELRRDDPEALALLSPETATPGQGIWVRWSRVDDFYYSGPDSRHFTLDRSSGEVRFGDGQRGRVPPVGRDNLQARRYRTHNGANGNVEAGEINVLRNPSGDLAKIKSVANPEAAAGGSDAETVDEVRIRGPQSLKHRQRAVTVEDYAWLAREASGEVAQARCLPLRNRQGLPEPGWVTVVITPESSDARPTPSSTLLRRVQQYLEQHALTNLDATNQILVVGPEYVQATALVQVAPSAPEKADEVELAVLARLEDFLHPLSGGPERQGWQLGRDVYLSEVYAEIEDVAGVDTVARLVLQASLQQQRLRLGGAARPTPFTLPVGAEVSSFDQRVMLLLAEPLAEGEPLDRLSVYGFKADDRVEIVAADNSPLVQDLRLAAVTATEATFTAPFVPPSGWAGSRRSGAQWRYAVPGGGYSTDALCSLDGRLRLPISGVDLDAGGQVTGVQLAGLEAGDAVCVVVGARRDPHLEFLPVAAVEPCQDRVFVPAGHLVFSGSHSVEMVLS